MSKSLQDQLLALGLAAKRVDQKRKPDRVAAPGPKPRKPDRVAAPGPKPRKPAKSAAPRTRPTAPDEEFSLAQAYKLRQQQEQSEMERAKQLQREEILERQRLNRQIKSLVEPNRLNRPEAEIGRYFMYKGRIRKINLTEEQRTQLNNGHLGVVYMAGAYHLLPAEQVAQVKSLSAEHVPDLSPGDEAQPQDDVPDDLIW